MPLSQRLPSLFINAGRVPAPDPEDLHARLALLVLLLLMAPIEATSLASDDMR